MAAQCSGGKWFYRLRRGSHLLLGIAGRLRDNKITRQQVVEQIARRYMEWVDTFESATRK
jgi:hypothetical protein